MLGSGVAVFTKVAYGAWTAVGADWRERPPSDRLPPFGCPGRTSQNTTVSPLDLRGSEKDGVSPRRRLTRGQWVCIPLSTISGPRLVRPWFLVALITRAVLRNILVRRWRRLTSRRPPRNRWGVPRRRVSVSTPSRPIPIRTFARRTYPRLPPRLARNPLMRATLTAATQDIHFSHRPTLYTLVG